MNSHIVPQGFLLSSTHGEFLLNLPKLRIGEGCLNAETCLEQHAEADNNRLAVHFRWRIQGRSFLGRATLEPHERGSCWRLRVAPEDGKCWQLFQSAEGGGALSGWTDTTKIRLFHGDNIRGVSQDVPLMEGSYFIPLSQWKRPLNAGRWQSFPGLWLTEGGRGFVCGALTQNVWKHTIHHERESSSTLRLRGTMTPPGIDARPFAEGEAYEGEALYFEWVEAETPAQAFAGYLAALDARLRPCKSRSLLRQAVSWGSWNDRQPHFWDVSEALLVRTAELLKKRFPTVQALQVDDGYADGGTYEIVADRWAKLEHGLDLDAEAKIECPRRLGAGFLHEPGHAIAADRFPNGMREARNRVAKEGFMPAIWLGLNLVFDATLAKDHSDWMILSRPWQDTDPELLTVFGHNSSQGFRVLDPSLPDVRCYLGRIAETLFKEWGFGSLKLDFWSYAFENDSFRLQRGEKSAYEWRHWLFEMFRSTLAPQGFFTIGCDISTGNPFLSPWADNIRYGIDIGNGKWENIKYTALTGTFLLHIEAYRFYLLNSDAVGLLKRLPETERQVFLAWTAVTRSLCEIAGDLAHAPREALRILQKLLLAPKNGDAAFPGEMQHLESNEPAAVLWTRGDLFSVTTNSAHLPEAVLAVFNWTDTPRTIVVNAERMGPSFHHIADVEFFGGTHVFRQGTQWEITLPPRSVRLSQLSFLSASEPRIIESSWQIRELEMREECLELNLYGDSPEGFLVYWPEAEDLALQTSLPVCVTREDLNVFRITPQIDKDQLGEWEASLRKVTLP